MDYAQRRRQLFTDRDAQYIALVPGANMHYFTGLDYHPSERPIVAFFARDDAATFILPRLEVSRLSRQPDLADARVFAWSDEDGYADAFVDAAAALNLDESVLGVDDQTMRVFEWLALEHAAPQIRLRRYGQHLLSQRARKSADEVALLRRAIAISEAALAELLAQVQPGMTELEIAARLESLLNVHGAQGLAFSPLVQTGPNAADPHGTSTERALQEGESLLIDFGAKLDGYPADITRTVCIGEPSAKLTEIHALVLAANQAAIAAAGPGVSASAVDQAARDVIESAGYGEYFMHRTGHGLGLEVHELPQIAAGNDAPLELGMVFTVEPGIYLPGVGGVRIEDNVHVTGTGVEVLTAYPRDLRLR